MGVIFIIKKIDPLNYVDGSQAVAQVFDTYKIEKTNSSIERNMTKIRKHFSDVFLAAVIEPKLARKQDLEGIFVDNLFTDWDLASKLYEEIMLFTYGKKKLKQSMSPEKSV